jgi:DNA-binding transcriptional LysR family regulator
MDRFALMETFISVIEAGSFSAAARRLNVGQPAVSKSIAQLEAKLGVRLLLRSTRGLTPTEAGQQFYERAKRALEEADEAELAARGSGAGLSGRLRICAAVTFARLHIVPEMKTFLAAHPDLTLEVLLDDDSVNLLEQGIDVALRMGVLGDSSMTARRLGESRRLVVGTPAYFEQAGVPAAPADLLLHQAIIYDQPGGGTSWTFRRDGSELAVAVDYITGRHRQCPARVTIERRQIVFQLFVELDQIIGQVKAQTESVRHIVMGIRQNRKAEFVLTHRLAAVNGVLRRNRHQVRAFRLERK